MIDNNFKLVKHQGWQRWNRYGGKLGLFRWIEQLPKWQFVGNDKWFKRGLTVSVILGILVIIGLCYQLLNGGEWNQINNFNAVVMEKSSRRVGVMSFQPEKNRLIVVWLGSDILVPAVYGYGDYRIGVIKQLGDQEGYGSKLLEKSIEQWMGIPIIGVLEINDKQIKLSEPSFWRSHLLWAKGGSLCLADRLKLLANNKGFSQTKIIVLGVDSGEIKILPNDDGKTRVSWNQENISIINYLFDSQIAKAVDNGIAVVNATNHSGLGRQAVLVLKNMGYDVVSVVDGEQLETESKLLVDPNLEKSEWFWQPLSQVITNRIVIDDTVEEVYRAKIAVVVGEDYYELVGKQE